MTLVAAFGVNIPHLVAQINYLRENDPRFLLSTYLMIEDQLLRDKYFEVIKENPSLTSLTVPPLTRLDLIDLPKIKNLPEVVYTSSVFTSVLPRVRRYIIESIANSGVKVYVEKQFLYPARQIMTEQFFSNFRANDIRSGNPLENHILAELMQKNLEFDEIVNVLRRMSLRSYFSVEVAYQYLWQTIKSEFTEQGMECRIYDFMIGLGKVQDECDRKWLDSKFFPQILYYHGRTILLHQSITGTKSEKIAMVPVVVAWKKGTNPQDYFNMEAMPEINLSESVLLSPALTPLSPLESWLMLDPEVVLSLQDPLSLFSDVLLEGLSNNFQKLSAMQITNLEKMVLLKRKILSGDLPLDPYSIEERLEVYQERKSFLKKCLEEYGEGDA